MPARTQRSRCIGPAAWLILAALMLSVSCARHLGLRLNTTSSLPMGLWRLTSLLRPPARGEIVSLCPPPTALFLEAKARFYLGAGSCPGGLEPMLKPVAGLPGDHVEATEAGISVNGTLLANSKPLAADLSGRPLTPLASGSFQLPEGSILLVSSFNPQSFDSRYFGPLPISAVQSLAHPVLVIPR
ncbi:MAG: conjugative transfer signal peptidase TraF [Rhodomicrobium sp.]